MALMTLITLFGTMVVLVVIPGPGVFTVVARSMACGFYQGAFTVIGVVTADIVFIILTIFGLSAIADYMGDLFVLVKYLGGIYLIGLGVQLWLSKPEAVEMHDVQGGSRLANFLSGLFVTLGNPKAILFYVSLFPAFIELSNVSIIEIASVMITIVLAVSSVMLSYAYMASKTGVFFNSVKAKKRMNIAAGSVMIGTGTILVARS